MIACGHIAEQQAAAVSCWRKSTVVSARHGHEDRASFEDGPWGRGEDPGVLPGYFGSKSVRTAGVHLMMGE